MVVGMDYPLSTPVKSPIGFYLLTFTQNTTIVPILQTKASCTFIGNITDKISFMSPLSM